MFVTGAQPVIATRAAKAEAVHASSKINSATPSQNIGPRARPKARAKAKSASRLDTQESWNGSLSL